MTAGMTDAVAVKVKTPYSAVLRNKRFRALWLSQFVSGLGDWRAS